MSPFSAGFWITTSRGYPKDAPTLGFYGGVAVEPRRGRKVAYRAGIMAYRAGIQERAGIREYEQTESRFYIGNCVPGALPGTYGVVGTQKHGCGLPYVDRARRPETGATPTRATTKPYPGPQSPNDGCGRVFP